MRHNFECRRRTCRITRQVIIVNTPRHEGDSHMKKALDERQKIEKNTITRNIKRMKFKVLREEKTELLDFFRS